MIPNEQTKKFEKEEISLKSFLESTEFMDLEFKPTIEFNDKMIITKKIRTRNFSFEEKLLNMAKPLNCDIITGIAIKQTTNLENNLQLVCDHIETIICGNNDEVYQYVLKFISCT